MPAIPKPIRRQCREYLDFLKGYQCQAKDCVRLGVDPHHVGSVGSGGSDFGAIPLCRPHHELVHSMGAESFEAQFFPDAYEVTQATFLARFIEHRVNEDKKPWLFSAEEIREALNGRYRFNATGSVREHAAKLEGLGWERGKLGYSLEGAQPWDSAVTSAAMIPGVHVERVRIRY